MPPSPDALPAITEVLRHRRTIHLFTPQKPPEALVRAAIDVARWAPNHRLTEPWRFYLLGPETALRVVDLNAELVAQKRGPKAGAAKRERWAQMPGWLVVTSQRSDDALREREDYAATCCALNNLLLYLWSEGVGTKWTTGPVTRDERFYEIAGVDPEAETVVGLVWYGYPATMPTGTRRLEVEDVLVERP